MDQHIYKSHGYFLIGKLITYSACVAVLCMIFVIFGHHWITKTYNLLLVISSVLYLRYLKQNSEVKLSFGPEGFLYTGIRRSGLKITTYEEKLQWDKINNIFIGHPEKGPIQIETKRGSLLFWNAENPSVNTEIMSELRKYIKTGNHAAEHSNQPTTK